MRLESRLALTIVLLLAVRALPGAPQNSEDNDPPPGDNARSALLPAAPARPAGGAVTAVPGQERGVDWTGLFRSSGRFLAVEQAFRLATEPGTREGLKGS